MFLITFLSLKTIVVDLAFFFFDIETVLVQHGSLVEPFPLKETKKFKRPLLLIFVANS